MFESETELPFQMPKSVPVSYTHLHRARILGVTYEFSQTGERKTVWYTPNKRRAKKALVLSELTQT